MDVERMKRKIDAVMENYKPGAELVFIHANNCREMLNQGACSCEPHVGLVVPAGSNLSEQANANNS